MSVCEIETAETYEKGRPKRGGLSDPRMGTMDRQDLWPYFSNSTSA